MTEFVRDDRHRSRTRIHLLLTDYPDLSIGICMAPRAPRDGKILETADKREVGFSFYTMSGGDQGRRSLQSPLYASNPWNPIIASIQRLQDKKLLEQCLMFIRQSQDYFNAASEARSYEAKPTLYYYTFLNIVKAMLASTGAMNLSQTHTHGLSDQTRSGSFLEAKVKFCRYGVFPELARHIGYTYPPGTRAIVDIAKQVLLGHRFWVDAYGGKEKFIRVQYINYYRDSNDKKVWAYLEVSKNSVRKVGVSQYKLAERCGMGTSARIVTPFSKRDFTTLPSDGVVALESSRAKTYASSPLDELHGIGSELKSHLWRALYFVDPYRRYYLYIRDLDDDILPQIISVYVIMYLLGSITRYNPNLFQDWISSEYGSFIREFIDGQPVQFLYEISSLTEQREIIQAPIV